MRSEGESLRRLTRRVRRFHSSQVNLTRIMKVFANDSIECIVVGENSALGRHADLAPRRSPSRSDIVGRSVLKLPRSDLVNANRDQA